jgi:uncharacterized membrane protein (Fun14 family)
MGITIHTIINYALTEYIDILKCIGVYFIVLSTMAQLGIEKLNDNAKNLLKNPIIYFITILSISLLITGDNIIVSSVGSILYFVVLFIAKNYRNFKTKMQNLMSKT